MAASDAPVVLSSRDPRGVVTITLNRPQAMNALSEEMLAALTAELDAVGRDETARVVVLAGAGRAFSAGHDLKEMRAAPSLAYYRDLFGACTAVMLAIQRLPVPVIARVHGIAAAAGCQLVAQCDLAVASTEARFAVSGVNYGLFCSTPSVALSRNLNRKQAMEMLLTGDFIDAAEAEARGLVNHVVAPDDLDPAIAALVAKILAKARTAVAIGKAQFYRQIEAGIAEAYAIAGEAMACNMMDRAALDGVQAFIDKRRP